MNNEQHFVYTGYSVQKFAFKIKFFSSLKIFLLKILIFSLNLFKSFLSYKRKDKVFCLISVYPKIFRKFYADGKTPIIFCRRKTIQKHFVAFRLSIKQD